VNGEREGPPEVGPRPGHHSRTEDTDTNRTLNPLQDTGHRAGYQLRIRRAASWRLPAPCSGRSDPWWYPEPGERGYEDAAAHLLELGLTPAPNPAALRAMWMAGGQSRRAAEVIAERWGLVA
jgi:hypothetical protein